MPHPKIVVIGSGMAGFGASNRLRSEGIEAVLYAKGANGENECNRRRTQAICPADLAG